MIGAVDIGGTKIAAGLVDDQGRLHARRQILTSPRLSLKTGLDEIVRMLSEACAETRAEMEGVGIACTGQIDPEGRLKPNAFLPDWFGADLAGELSRMLGARTALENDADAAALAEAAWGTGKGMNRFILVTVGTGIGCGLVFDGKLYRGVDSAHPELGHHVIDPSGPLCFCGARGCWEQMASGPAMSRWLWERERERDPEAVRLDAGTICQRAVQGEPLALQAVEREGYYLGLGLANLVTIFAPEVISLGGNVMKSWALFSEGARRVIEKCCGLVPREKTAIRLAELGPEASLIGAAQVWISRYGK